MTESAGWRSPGIPRSGLSLQIDARRFLVHKANNIALMYVLGGSSNKPYLSTLQGPSARNVLEDAPADHLHHRGVWWGHGDVNGVDFYTELPQNGMALGAIEHVDFTAVVDDAPRYGFVELLRWKDPDGSTLIEEERKLVATFGPDDHYIVDLSTRCRAQVDLRFGDTKESTMPGIRPAEALCPAAGGKLTSSEGDVGEDAVFGKPAAWVDYSGKRPDLFGREVFEEGIVCMSHPSNSVHPPPFFARDYGPMSPWQGNYFVGETRLAEGETMELRHRLVVHAGGVDLDGMLEAFAAG